MNSYFNSIVNINFIVYIKRSVKKFLKKIFSLPDLFRCLINKYLLKQGLLKKYSALHLGCGDIRLDNCINVDYRATPATDITHDCSNLDVFPENSFSAVYSNAFFEHLYLNQRTTCLKSIHRVLKDYGFVIFTGIPDFENVAYAYLNKEKITDTKLFDLEMAYRYTHGKPELYPSWWLEQLHKSLFDTEKVKHLLTESNFKHFIIFKCGYINEKLILSLGFVGFKQKPKQKITVSWLKKKLQKYSKTIDFNTIKIV